MKKLRALTLKEFGGKITPQSFFLALALAFGLFFVLIIPPFQAPDEPVHFFRSYQISQLNPSVDKVGSTYGGRLPVSLQDTVSQTYDRSGLAFHPGLKYNVHYTSGTLSIKTTDAKRVYDFSSTAPYSPISYIPQSIGVGVARLFNLPPILMLYAGRLCNLLAWCLLFYVAIRLMPRKKWVVAFIGLIPMALAEAASMSADVMSLGLLVVSFALILRYVEKDQRLSNYQIGSLLAILTLLSLTKQIMFLFVGLVLLLPAKLFKDGRRALIIKSALIIVPLVLVGLWSLHVRNIPFSSSVGGINPHAQERFIVHQPFDYINALFNTYFYSWGDGIVKSFIGNFGWVDTPLAELIVIPGYIALFLLMTASTERTKQWLNRAQKFVIGTILAVYILALSTALYSYSTPVGFKIVVGLVGRYYFPVALLLIPLVAGNWLRTSRKAYRAIAIGAPVFLLVCSAITIYVRYYINNV